MFPLGVVNQQADWDPAMIDDCLVWLDASDRGTTTDQWDDKSGNDNHFIAPTNKFPSFAAGIATFGSGGEDYLSWDGWDSTGITSMEMFIVLKRDSGASSTGTDSGSFGYFCGGTDHYTYSATIYNSFFSTTRHNCGTPIVDVDSAFRTVNIWSALNDWNMNIDGSEQYNTTTNTTIFSPTDDTLTIGASNNAGGYYFYGEIKAVVMFSRKLTTVERAQMELYLANL